jgi:hypothetical protein
MEFGNGHIMGADLLANLAVITKFEPFGRDDFSLKPETLGIGPGKLRAWKKAGGSQYRTVGVADGTFDALIDVRFHLFFFTTERAEAAEKIPAGCGKTPIFRHSRESGSPERLEKAGFRPSPE